MGLHFGAWCCRRFFCPPLCDAPRPGYNTGAFNRGAQPGRGCRAGRREVHLEGGTGRKHQSRHLGSTAGGLGYSDGALLVFFTSKYPENTALVPRCPVPRGARNTPKTAAHRQHAQRDRTSAPPPASQRRRLSPTGAVEPLLSRFFACATFYFATLPSFSTNAAS